MSGRGEKRQLTQLIKNLEQMLKLLGEDTGSTLIINIDEFQYLRRDFLAAAEVYEKSTADLAHTSDKKQRGILIYHISSNREVMDQSLKQMTKMVVRMNDKIKESKHRARKEEDISKQETQLQYKNLTIFNLQKHYFRMTKKEPAQASKGNNKHYPDAVTLEELMLKKPERRGFTERTDEEGEQYLEEKEILDAIKHIDNRIEQKMDYILSGLQMLNFNALSIRDGIDEVQRKIVINVEQLEDNLEQLEDAEDLLEQAAPQASKPNCIMNVVIVFFLAIIVYLIVRKLWPDADNGGNDIK